MRTETIELVLPETPPLGAFVLLAPIQRVAGAPQRTADGQVYQLPLPTTVDLGLVGELRLAPAEAGLELTVPLGLASWVREATRDQGREVLTSGSRVPHYAFSLPLPVSLPVLGLDLRLRKPGHLDARRR